MWKLSPLLMLVLMASSSRIPVVGLKPTPCTATRTCYAVMNDGVGPNGGPLVIGSISASATNGRVTLSIAGTVYDSGIYAVYPMGLNLTNVRLTDSVGHQVVLSARYTHWTTLNQSGHDDYVQHWRLDRGTLTFL